MPETPNHRCRRPLGCYRCAMGCYRLLPDAGNVGWDMAFLKYATQGRGLLPVLPVSVTHTPICNGSCTRGLHGGAQSF